MSLISDAKGQDREVSLDMKRGVEAKNYEAIAKAEQLKPLEVELRRYATLPLYLVTCIRIRCNVWLSNVCILYLLFLKKKKDQMPSEL